MSFDDADLLAQLDALGGGLQATVRPVAQAGAQVFYEEVRLRAPVGTKVHGYKGKPKAFAPGNLRDAIYQVYSKDRSVEGKAYYQISFNRKKAYYGGFVEHGTAKTPAQPYIRPAYDTQKQAALDASHMKLVELAQKVIHGT
ncbi:HK97-gp10 family putative phage morphogenesis protein [Rhodoferax sp. WC2427]|uniref:HK97-gp10 family putative phage morphogenesis protein n=1 Tax=Rhodoferax sp. WC2427 TaxID=3234144 RepID=UPI0034664F84